MLVVIYLSVYHFYNIFLPFLQRMALLIACFCHDLDHRGYNNAFLANTDAPLSGLYSSSLLENHHFTQTLALLQIPGLNIFSHLTEQEYKKV